MEGDGAGFAAIGDADGFSGVEAGHIGREENCGIARSAGDANEIPFAEACVQGCGAEAFGIRR
ncbi:MAG: hypothetical protein RL215_3488 [Planctomycetota bacterium]